MEENRIVPHIGEANMEASLKQRLENKLLLINMLYFTQFLIVSIGDLNNSKTEQMVKFLPLILEKLIGLIVSPPLLNGQLLKCAGVAFDCFVAIVGTFTVSEIMRNIDTMLIEY